MSAPTEVRVRRGRRAAPRHPAPRPDIPILPALSGAACFLALVLAVTGSWLELSALVSAGVLVALVGVAVR